MKVVRHSSHLKAKACGISLEMCRVRKLHAISLVIQTCWSNLDLNLYVVPPMICIFTISEDSLVRRGVKYVAI